MGQDTKLEEGRRGGMEMRTRGGIERTTTQKEDSDEKHEVKKTLGKKKEHQAKQKRFGMGGGEGKL